MAFQVNPTFEDVLIDVQRNRPKTPDGLGFQQSQHGLIEYRRKRRRVVLACVAVIVALAIGVGVGTSSDV